MVERSTTNPPGQAGPSSGPMAMLSHFLEMLLGGDNDGNGLFSSLMKMLGIDTPSSSSPTTSAAPARTAAPVVADAALPGPRAAPQPLANIFSANTGFAFPRDPNFSSTAALTVARRDNAGNGHCAQGVANILQSQGYDVVRGDAHNWDTTLPQKGWVKIPGIDARNAPEGAVLVYDSDVRQGRNARNSGGGKFGHAEIVCYDGSGNRVYVSDAARGHAGGSVPENFIGAYVPRERYDAMVKAGTIPAAVPVASEPVTRTASQLSAPFAAVAAGIAPEITAAAPVQVAAVIPQQALRRDGPA